MKKREYNTWDGFDTSECVNDEKEEKKYHAKIWIILLAVAVICLGMIINHFVKLRILVNTGNTVVATYNERFDLAEFTDDNGRYHSVNLAYYDEVRDENSDEIILYYDDDIYKARPDETFISNFKMFMFFLLMAAICIFKIYKVYRPKKHADENEA